MSKIKIEIKNRWTGYILFEWESEGNTIKETLIEAINSRANLSGANLSDADLSDAYLSGAYLSGANLSRADLSDADLSGANLSDAYLSGANLSRADLSDADLSDAYLSGANLSRADLSDADLSRADLSRIKYDFFGRLLTQKEEVKYLKEKLMAGEINGCAYEGVCCCFVGTIANSKKCNYNNLNGLKPDSDSPTEKWFLGIKKGDTPDNSQISKITLDWIEEFESILLR